MFFGCGVVYWKHPKEGVSTMLGARIAVLRRAKGWNQSDLAKQLGVSSSAVGMYEQGRRQPAADVLVKLAEIFEVTTDFLLTGRAQTQQENRTVEDALAKTLLDADNRLLKRDRRPFTRDELTVLFTAMLLDT